MIPESKSRQYFSRFFWWVKWVKGRQCSQAHYTQPHRPLEGKQVLFYYWISSQALWTEHDLLCYVFFLNLVWNIFQHSLKIQPLWIHWWVFKYTLGQIALSRKQIRFPSLMESLLSLGQRLVVFCIGSAEALVSLYIYLCLQVGTASHTLIDTLLYWIH